MSIRKKASPASDWATKSDCKPSFRRACLRRRHRSSENLPAEDDAFLGPVAIHRPKSAHGQPRCAHRSLSAEQFLTVVDIPRKTSAKVARSRHDALTLSRQVEARPLSLHRQYDLPLVHVPLPPASRQLLIQNFVRMLKRLKKLFLASAHIFLLRHLQKPRVPDHMHGLTVSLPAAAVDVLPLCRTPVRVDPEPS